MVNVRVLNGGLANQIFNATELGFSPQDILCGISGYKWHWETDLSEATAEEKSTWESQDISMKMVRALAQNASVHILDREYRTDGLQNAFTIAAEIEELILNDGRKAVITQDNHEKLIIELQ